MNYQYNPLLQENTLRRIKKALGLSKGKIKDKELTNTIKKVLTDPVHRGLPRITKDGSIRLSAPSKENQILNDYIRRIKRASKNRELSSHYDTKHGFGVYKFFPDTGTEYHFPLPFKSKTLPSAIKSNTPRLDYNISNNPEMLRSRVAKPSFEW